MSGGGSVSFLAVTLVVHHWWAFSWLFCVFSWACCPVLAAIDCVFGEVEWPGYLRELVFLVSVGKLRFVGGLPKKDSNFCEGKKKIGQIQILAYLFGFRFRFVEVFSCLTRKRRAVFGKERQKLGFAAETEMGEVGIYRHLVNLPSSEVF